MKLKNTFCFPVFIALVSLLIASCGGSDSKPSSNRARMQVFLTDDPGNYQEVLIDVRDVRINYSSDTASGWQSLANVRTGTYDLLKLVNNRDTMLADADLAAGRIQQIRLVLGPNNFVKVNNQTFPLETPSAQQSGLKINIRQDVNAGVLYKLLLDFDAGRSIVKTGNNKYILKPVIRATLRAQGGSLRGFVNPATFVTNVFAIQGADTVAGTLTSSGNYYLRGLNAGTYTLAFVPGDTTFRKQTKSGIIVNNNSLTTIDTVTLVR